MEESFRELMICDYASSAIMIQKIYRGFIARNRILPLIFYRIRTILENTEYKIDKKIDDGRINSAINEGMIIDILKSNLRDRVKKSNDRMWHDITVFDNLYGWLPVNIKLTTTKTYDNIGNFALCVQAYTDVKLDIRKKAHNGRMSRIFMDKILSGEINRNPKKDYYFIVINKNTKSIIVNSMKGIINIAHNTNNLPFQIRWDRNREFVYRPISEVITMVMDTMKKNETELANGVYQ